VNVLFRVACAFPVDQSPIVDAGLWVVNNAIKAIAPWQELKQSTSAKKTIELKDHVITPGFVNCHAHLELTALRGKIPFKKNFLDWAALIMDQRRKWSRSDLKKSTQEGLEELINSGCTTVADYSSEGLSYNTVKQSGIRGIGFYELIQFDPAQFSNEKEKIKKFISQKVSHRFRRGIAVHAPYSVHPYLIKWCFRQKASPLSIHLSELKEEVEFVEKNPVNNIFRKIREQRPAWLKEWKVPGVSPVRYLENLGAKNYTAVHLNYLRSGDVESLKRRSATAVYCPLSHQFFSHSRHPLLKLRKGGVIVGLGTDSCASNLRCDMREEMCAVKQTYKSLKDSDILSMATLEGATALNMDKDIGSLTVGKKADVIFFKMSSDPKTILKNIVSQRPEVSAIMCDGKWVKAI